jgi:hypothetical protein
MGIKYQKAKERSRGKNCGEKAVSKSREKRYI